MVTVYDPDAQQSDPYLEPGAEQAHAFDLSDFHK